MASAIKGKSGAAIIDGSALDQRSITPARELLNGEPSRGALKEGCPAKRRRYRTLPHLLGLGPSARGGPGGRPSPRQEAGPVISSERGRPSASRLSHCSRAPGHVSQNDAFSAFLLST